MIRISKAEPWHRREMSNKIEFGWSWMPLGYTREGVVKGTLSQINNGYFFLFFFWWTKLFVIEWSLRENDLDKHVRLLNEDSKRGEEYRRLFND